MKKIFLYSFVLLLLLATGCDKWVDVSPENQKVTEEQLSSYSGFCDVLNGCYIQLTDRDIYGEKLTMSNIESMAQLWRSPEESSLPADYALRNFDYTNSYAESAVISIYSGLYKTIAYANMIINNMDEYGSVITDESKRSVIEGEAYAIRAFCHFDVLRLFGQLPQNPSVLVSLPYAETVSKEVLPAYYSYAGFVAKIESDLNKAELLLNGNDPVFEHTFDELNDFDPLEITDDFMAYRQNRFNYWAVKALQARFYLYTGNATEAYAIAKSIINATGVDGNKLIELSGGEDIAQGYFACPSECLMMLNAIDILDYSTEVLATGATYATNSHLVLEDNTDFHQLEELFAGQATVSNNRYQKLWTHNLYDRTGTSLCPSLKKYYYTESSETGFDLIKHQAIPLIRLSEMYLIVMETTTDLAEANSLWQEYQLSHEVQVSANMFASFEDLQNGIIDEYRREFYGEGQMFYTYKRLGTASMLWRDDTVDESDYIVPLPNTEYNPNDI